MTPTHKLRRSIRQETVLKFFKHISKSHLGLRLTTGQLKEVARKAYDVKLAEARTEPTRKPMRFWWEHNEQHTPVNEGVLYEMPDHYTVGLEDF